MCESHAYLAEGEEPRLIMEDVVDIREEDGILYLSNIVGESLTLAADISEISFFQHRILLTPRD
ncbi:MAG: CooT family nickel-binding protein [Candidatus Geothermincolia bacterium]